MHPPIVFKDLLLVIKLFVKEHALIPIVEHTRNTERGEGKGESIFYSLMTFSYFINHEKLFIHVQYDHQYQCIKNIHHKQEVHQNFYVETQMGKTIE